ncbi:MAG: thiazole synthase [Chloroflexi bacterium]|nr:thiazole synthase [Chloroflexota bacterium]
MSDELIIGERRFRSRLMLGTGKYRNVAEMQAALAASGTEIVTVAIRRLDLDNPGQNLLDHIDWGRYTVLPNTAGCALPEEALRVARLARALGLPDWIKLEVIPDSKYLLPDPIGTLEAARLLIEDGFAVLPYINDDPVLARRLQELGTVTVMPLASPIGSGRGLVNFDQIKIIVEQATVPVVVDAGLGVPSDAALAMEIGADACLVNTAIAQARDPEQMAQGFRLGVEAGRLAYRAGRVPKHDYAVASSPLEGVVR